MVLQCLIVSFKLVTELCVTFSEYVIVEQSKSLEKLGTYITPRESHHPDPENLLKENKLGCCFESGCEKC